MKAVWSFWSKPFYTHRAQVWLSEKHHLLSWLLSLATTARHYELTALYTDDDGARMLVDGLGLEFDEVITSLNMLKRHDPQWWALGKLYTYREQNEAFVHVDSDVYLWKPLPQRMLHAPLLAQNPEFFTPGESYYEPEAFERAIAKNGIGWLPPEWLWYRARGMNQHGENCGVFGGVRCDFIQHYASQAIKLLEDRDNRRAWQQLGSKERHTVVAEQYLLAACIDYHQYSDDSQYRDIRIEYLFESMSDAFDAKKAERVGYTHLIANAKRNLDICNMLEVRVAQDYPEQYERCLSYLGSESTLSA